jgi:drug/metabolite transporter (DMT)-like permease
MRGRGQVYAALGLVALFWGSAFPAIKRSLEELSPATVALLRFAVTDLGLIVIAIAWPAARPHFERRDGWRVAVLAITGVPIYHLALNWGEQRTTASVSSLVIATAPVLVAVGSTLVLRERIGRRAVAGIALAFGGVALLAWTAAPATGDPKTSLIGVLVVFIASLAWAAYVIVGKPLTGRVPSIQIGVGTILLGSLGLLPTISSNTFHEIGNLSAAAWGWILLLGAGAGVGGYLLFIYALSRLEATKVSVVLYLIPVVSLLMSALVLGEPLGVWTPVAAAGVIGGVALVERDRKPARDAEPELQPKKTSATS